MREYDDVLVATLGSVLRERLVGVYVSGSVALGDYVPGRSDLDRFVVVSSALPRTVKEDVVASTRHESLPCPARGLELVVYTAEAAGRPPRGADFELNLNSGRGMPFHVSFEPADEPAHWFVLDRAIVRERGWALLGPPPEQVFAPVPRHTALAALAQSLRWHGENAELAGPNLVLNALRAWRFAATGEWVSKADAARWGPGQGADRGLVDAALAGRMSAERPPLDAERSEALLARVLAEVAGSGGRYEVDVPEEHP